MWRIYLPLLGMLFFLTNCNNRASIEGFDTDLWKNDKMACDGHRKELISALDNKKEIFLGMSQTEVINILGKPDYQELSRRNLKYYYYFYLPGPQCESTPDRSFNNSLQIRFNNVGYANEILIN